MRRILSKLLVLTCVLILGAGTVMADVPAAGLRSGWTGNTDESRLPACCRKGGKHHCDMGAAGDTVTGHTLVSARECCPLLPRALVSTAPSAAAIVASDVHSAALETQQAIGIPDSEAPRGTRTRSWPKRGPPQTQTL